jgi:ribosomal-protein-alanine N-acetyltransferase
MAAVSKDLPLLEATLRPMGDDDVAEVARLEAVSYAFPWSDGIFRDSLRVGYQCSVLELGVVLAGYTVLTTGARESHLLNLCVRESFRCRGLGSRLLRNLFQQAIAADARIMFLETRPSNQSALRLYLANGFTQIGVRRAYYQAAGGREDAIVMRKDLVRT